MQGCTESPGGGGGGGDITGDIVPSVYLMIVSAIFKATKLAPVEFRLTVKGVFSWLAMEHAKVKSCKVLSCGLDF